MIRISLIVATYNRSAQLMETLASVARQDLPAAEWECVVVDNNSTDDTAERFDAFAARHPELNLRRVCERRQGLSWARNCGIDRTTGPCIAIIDDDEVVNAGFLRAYVEFFDAHPAVASAGGRIIARYPAGRPAWMSPYTERPIANPIDLGDAARPFPAGRIPGGGNMALRRTAVARHGAFNPELGRTGAKLLGGEESDLFARLAAAGEACWYVPGAVMYHIIPPAKLTRDYFERLCFHVGRTQRARARLSGGEGRLRLAEAAKWGATLLLAAGYALGGHPARGRWLLRMRRCITRGIFTKEE